MSIVDRYSTITRKSNPQQVSNVLDAIITGQVKVTSERESLVKLILEDLQSRNTNGRFANKDLSKAILALKTLGREPDAARLLGTKPSLEFLMTITQLSPEVTRIIANTLLLHAPARQTFNQVDGAEFSFNMLNSTNDSTTLFIACRLIFLCTHDSSSVDRIELLLDKTNIIEATITKMDVLKKRLHEPSESAMAIMGLTDMLKYIYNMILHYSRSQAGGNTVMGEAWSDRFAPWVSPLLQLFGTLPFSMSSTTPITAPMTHVIHCLLNIPIEPYESTWFPQNRRSRSNSPPQTLTSRARSLFNGSRSSSRQGSPTSSTSSNRDSTTTDYVRQSYDLVNKCLEHYFPGTSEVDGEEVRAKQLAEDVKLNELLPPCFLLLRKIAEENEPARRRIKNWILPDDLERKTALESRPDVLGRLIRLLSSVHFSELQKCSGELLFAICDSDPSQLSSQIGYGNAAGFLFSKQIMFNPPSGAQPAPGPSSGGNGGPMINPITGTEYQEINTSGLAEMTEEEKEREAEKLFVLFDRLEKSGMGTNPIRQAQQEGKLEEYRERLEEKGGEDSD